MNSTSLTSIIDKHAPILNKIIKTKCIPQWYNEALRKIKEKCNYAKTQYYHSTYKYTICTMILLNQYRPKTAMASNSNYTI